MLSGWGSVGPGVAPLWGEWRFLLGTVQCGHCLSGVTGVGDGPLLPFPSTLPGSIPFPSWQLGRNLLKSHVCDSLSEVWHKRPVSLVTLPSSGPPLHSLIPSSLFSWLHEFLSTSADVRLCSFYLVCDPWPAGASARPLGLSELVLLWECGCPLMQDKVTASWVCDYTGLLRRCLRQQGSKCGLWGKQLQSLTCMGLTAGPGGVLLDSFGGDQSRMRESKNK